MTESVELDGIECLSHLQSITLLEQVRSYPVTILDDVQLADAAELSLLHNRLHDAGIRVPRHAWQNHRER